MSAWAMASSWNVFDSLNSFSASSRADFSSLASFLALSRSSVRLTFSLAISAFRFLTSLEWVALADLRSSDYLEAVVSDRLNEIDRTGPLQRLQVRGRVLPLGGSRGRRVRSPLGADIRKRGWWAKASAVAMGFAPIVTPTEGRCAARVGSKAAESATLPLPFWVVEALPLWRARRVTRSLSMWAVEASKSEVEEISTTFSNSSSL
nr:hypothetical protein Iba_chr03fCG2590 [Ipomoea batatas]